MGRRERLRAAAVLASLRANQRVVLVEIAAMSGLHKGPVRESSVEAQLLARGASVQGGVAFDELVAARLISRNDERVTLTRLGKAVCTLASPSTPDTGTQSRSPRTLWPAIISMTCAAVAGGVIVRLMAGSSTDQDDDHRLIPLEGSEEVALLPSLPPSLVVQTGNVSHRAALNNGSNPDSCHGSARTLARVYLYAEGQLLGYVEHRTSDECGGAWFRFYNNKSDEKYLHGFLRVIVESDLVAISPQEVPNDREPVVGPFVSSMGQCIGFRIRLLLPATKPSNEARTTCHMSPVGAGTPVPTASYSTSQATTAREAAEN